MQLWTNFNIVNYTCKIVNKTLPTLQKLCYIIKSLPFTEPVFNGKYICYTTHFLWHETNTVFLDRNDLRCGTSDTLFAFRFKSQYALKMRICDMCLFVQWSIILLSTQPFCQNIFFYMFFSTVERIWWYEMDLVWTI